MTGQVTGQVTGHDNTGQLLFRRVTMASSNSKVLPNISQRVNDYLDGLQREFESIVTPMSGSSVRRFNLYLGHLKAEFEFMSLEIDSLQKDRDYYKGKGAYLALLLLI